MSPLIDLQGITIDLLRPTDSPVLTEALREAASATRPVAAGAGFDNKL